MTRAALNECHLLQQKNKILRAENAALKEQVERLEKERSAAKMWLLEHVFHAKERYGFTRTGYTLFTSYETAHRDIECRNCRLFETPELAVEAAIQDELTEARAAGEGE